MAAEHGNKERNVVPRVGRRTCASRSKVQIHSGEPPTIEFVCGYEAGHRDKFCGSGIANSEPFADVRWRNPDWDGQ